VGHRIEAWLDSKAESIDLSDYYQSNIDSFQTGSVEYPLSGLSQGTHRLKMRAWDTYNNSSVSQTVFDVVTSVGLQLSNIYNYPNPFASSTIFTLQHNQLNIVDAEVKIYTVAGRLIQILERKNLSDSFIQIPWDGRDREGDALANGVYLYKVIVKTQDGRLTSEALGKLSIMK
jgi:flagellar hook assembly protein FlgD